MGSRARWIVAASTWICIRAENPPAGLDAAERLDHVEAALLDLEDVTDEACLSWAHQLGLLQTIPGVRAKVAQVIIAETGADMKQFPSAAHLIAWAGLAPGIHESAVAPHPTGM